MPILPLCQLWAYFWVVHELKGQSASGFSYNDKLGAGIMEVNEQIWEDYVKTHKDVKPFKNKSFLDYYDMLDVMPAKLSSDSGSPSEAKVELNSSSSKDLDSDDHSGSATHSSISSVTCSWNSTVKKAHTSSGAQALTGMTGQLDNFNDTMHKILTLEQGDASTPQCKQKAMIQVQQLETDLSDDQLVSLINIFQLQAGAADAYLVLQREGLRKAWVQDKLKQQL
ncbi:hypothetical protein L226DRAFT_525741 [Lentinus tigrinus ALCF2SS1-7]|uniref:uncharacterized protein n=1 Tax=Lentinus tigrinus ALCF2SS1-7 TaxID=1328758 RepID=UPI001165CED1|nr:hypothetical protein L226DRAFT_525741 [Lentinus tigrinus ALCF2SS1-7]